MPSLGGDQYKWYCEIPPLAEPGNYPGGVKTKPPFEMGVDDFEQLLHNSPRRQSCSNLFMEE